jgi:hypothetical protein
MINETELVELIKKISIIEFRHLTKFAVCGTFYLKYDVEHSWFADEYGLVVKKIGNYMSIWIDGRFVCEFSDTWLFPSETFKQILKYLEPVEIINPKDIAYKEFKKKVTDDYDNRSRNNTSKT